MKKIIEIVLNYFRKRKENQLSKQIDEYVDSFYIREDNGVIYIKCCGIPVYAAPKNENVESVISKMNEMKLTAKQYVIKQHNKSEIFDNNI